jgi:periplasmic protein TonB
LGGHFLFLKCGTFVSLSGVCFLQAEEIMFREALLESSPFARKRSPWPMATAFTLQLMVASTVVILPLVSSGIISLPTHTPLLAPSQYAPTEKVQPNNPSVGHAGAALPTTRPVVAVRDSSHSIIDRDLKPVADPNPSPVPWLADGKGEPLSNLLPNAQPVPIPPPVKRDRIIVSHSNEAMLLSKVVPDYPTIARVAGIQGDVKLHAIIAKDGTIQSLTVMSGHPTLIRAALSAVEQWKYRPYMLNGLPVEVETFITVTFKRTN